MANEADWFKIYPAKYLSIAGRIPDGTQRAEFLYIAMHCLNQGQLPDDDDELAFITAIAVDRIKNLRPYLDRLCSAKDGKLIACIAEETIAERMEFGAKKAQAGKKGGEQRQAPPSKAKQKEAQLVGAQANPSQTSRHADKQTSMQKGASESYEQHPITTALEEIYPGSAMDFRRMQEMFDLAERLHATPEQVRAFPAWLETNFPKKADGPFTFRDLFDKSLKNGNGHLTIVEQSKYKCSICQDTASVSVFEQGEFSHYADCVCQSQEVAA